MKILNKKFISLVGSVFIQGLKFDMDASLVKKLTNYHQPTKLQEGNVFTGVCLSTRVGMMSLPV